jgi:hypothetical protein
MDRYVNELQFVLLSHVFLNGLKWVNIRNLFPIHYIHKWDPTLIAWQDVLFE